MFVIGFITMNYWKVKKVINIKEEETMIKIVAKKHLKEDQIEKFIEMAQPLIESSRAEEGNIFYDLHRHASDPNILAYIECWKDKEAIDLHNNSSHFKKYVPMLNDLCDEPGEVDIYEEV